MMNTQLGHHISTTVRSRKLALRAARAGLRVLAPRAPALAALWAERLFLTARRHERPFWETEALASAAASRVTYADGWLPTWTWSPSAGATFDDPPTVLLVHGWEGRGSQLATFVPPLLERGLRVVTFDAPGHGDSSLPLASVIEHARALCAVAKTVGPVHAIIGHSVGGAAALLATRLGLEAARFALVAPPTTPVQFASMFAKALQLEPTVQQAMLARLEARYEIPFAEIDARLDVARLQAPLLVVHDREDPVVSFEHGRALVEIAPRGSLLETNGLGHRAILRAPHVVAAVTHFVSEGGSPSFAESLDGELFRRDTRW